jgi:subtilase family serine protease
VKAAVTNVRRLIAIVTLTALAACSGGGGGSAPATAVVPPVGGTTSSSSSGGHGVTTLNASKAFTQAATLAGPATSISSVVLHVVPTLQNAAGLALYAQQANDPTNPQYRHFLTASEIGSRYGATAADYATVGKYFESFGLKVGGWPQRLSMTVAGPRPLVEKAIGTTFAFYHTADGHTLLAPNGSVQFSKALPVSALANVVQDPRAHWRNFVVRSSAPSQNILSGYAPQQIATAFDFTSAYNAGITGAGITIGIIGTGPAMQADFAAYRAQYNVGGSGTLTFPNTATTMDPVSGNAAANTGGSPTATPPPVTGPCGASDNPYLSPSESPTASCNPEDIEAQIDTEQATLARDATIAFYLTYVPAECNTPGSASCSPDPNTGLGYSAQGLAESDDEIQQIIADDSVDIVSGSYGGPEVLQNTSYVANALGGYDPSALVPSEMSALAAEGIAAFFSSGDEGAQGCSRYVMSFGEATCVSEPSSDTNVTAVGGVTVPLSNAGTFLGPITGWGQQTFFNGQGGASGGGISCIYPQPPWEQQPAYLSSVPLLTQAGSDVCSGSGPGRLLPDISLEGDPTTGVATIANVAFGSFTQAVYGGTSVAAPEMAAMWALVLQACKLKAGCATATGAQPYRLGNAAPLLWKIYQTQATYQSTVDDVTFGQNGIVPCYVAPTGSAPCTSNPTPAPGYSAGMGAGWDAVTGLGVPFARHLITAVTGY